VTIFVIVYSTWACAQAPPTATEGELTNPLLSGVFSQYVEHSYHYYSNISPALDRVGPSKETFQQRYWIDSRYASGADAPVLFYLDGESPGEYYLKKINLTYFAEKLKAHIVYLEHRYYGKSFPAEISPTDKADVLWAKFRPLTIDNVIEDAAEFEKSLQQEKRLSGKWIVIGGSYGGVLAAIYRLRHPELVIGALASSAPLHFRVPGSDVSELMPKTYKDAYIESMNQTKESGPMDPLSRLSYYYQSCHDFENAWYFVPKSMNVGQMWANAQAECSSKFHLWITLGEWNKKYYLPFVKKDGNASHILFTTGTDDPWIMESILPSDTEKNPRLTVFTINGGKHCSDLIALPEGNFEPIKKAQDLFIKLARRWLTTAP